MASTAGAGAVGAALDGAALRALHYTVLGLAFLVAALDGLDVQIVAFAAPALAPEFGLSRPALGPLFSAALAGMAGGAVLFGSLGDRYGRRAMLIFCVALFGTGTLATVLAGSSQQLLVLRLVTGLGLGGALPNAVTLVAEYTPARHRALFVTVMYLGFSTGGLLGGLVAGPLVEAGGWRALFWLGGALPLALCPVLFVALPESPLFLARTGASTRLAAVLRRLELEVATTPHGAPTEVTPPGRVAELFLHRRTRNTLLLWTAFFINLLVLFFLMNWLPTLLVDRGLPLAQAIRPAVAFNVGGMIGGLVLAWLSARYNPRRMLAGFFAGAAFAYASIGFAVAVPGGVYIAALATGIFAGGAQVGLYPLATRIYPTAVRVTGVGFAQAWGRIGSILGPLAGAALVALHPPFPAYFVVFGAPLLLAAGAIAALRERATP